MNSFSTLGNRRPVAAAEGMGWVSVPAASHMVFFPAPALPLGLSQSSLLPQVQVWMKRLPRSQQWNFISILRKNSAGSRSFVPEIKTKTQSGYSDTYHSSMSPGWDRCNVTFISKSKASQLIFWSVFLLIFTYLYIHWALWMHQLYVHRFLVSPYLSLHPLYHFYVYMSISLIYIHTMYSALLNHCIMLTHCKTLII